MVNTYNYYNNNKNTFPENIVHNITVGEVVEVPRGSKPFNYPSGDHTSRLLGEINCVCVYYQKNNLSSSKVLVPSTITWNYTIITSTILCIYKYCEGPITKRSNEIG